MIAPNVYKAFLDNVEDQMVLARKLGLPRTVKHLHKALTVARGEIPEAIPRVPEIVFTRIGPVREQG